MQIFFRRFLLILSLFVSLSTTAHADSISLALSAPAYADSSGHVLAYSGTITAPTGNAGIEYLNADSFTINDPYTVDDSSFLLNAPLFLAPGQTYSGLLFTVADILGSPGPSVFGSFSLIGGATASSTDVLGNATFSYAAAAAPEPSTIVFLLTGLIGLFFAANRRGALSASL